MEKEKRITWQYFILPLATLILLYAGVAWFVSTRIFHQPPPEPITLIKYSVSRFADFIDFDFFYFSLPEEWEAAFLEVWPDFPQSVKICEFHSLIDDYLKKPLFYKVFPYYIMISFLGCLGVTKVQQIALNEKTPEAKREDVHSRGVRFVASDVFCREIEKAVDDPAAMVQTNGGALYFSSNRLREHMAVFGASGTGKSQYLLAFLSSFLAKKSPETRCIVVDRKGEFFAHFCQPGDIIFNPFDARSVKWSLFNELNVPEKLEEIPADVKAISKILYPENSKDPFWAQSAAKVFCSAVAYCIKTGKLKNKEFVNFCNQEWGEIVKAFKTLPPELAAGLVIAGNQTTGGSILSTFQNGVEMFSACPDGDFCVRDWIHNGRGSLFLSSAGRNDNVFIPILSLFVDLIGREVKELPDSGAGGVKYLFLIDELAAYPAMQTLHFLVAEARSKGVAVIIATQTIQKMLKTYDTKDGKDIIGNCKTKIIFRTGEEDDATYLSKTIGSTEVQRTQRAENANTSTVFGRVDGREGLTKTKQIVQEAAVLSSDLMTLDTGNAIVLHPNAGADVAKIKFDPFKGKKRAIDFEPIQEKTISAREFAELEKKRAAQEEERKKEEVEKKKKEAEERAAQEAEEREKREKEEVRKMIERINRAEAGEKEATLQPEEEKRDEERPYDNYLL